MRYGKGQKKTNTSLWLVFNNSDEKSIDPVSVGDFSKKWDVLRSLLAEKYPNVQLSPQIEPECAKQVTPELLKILMLERY